PPKSGDRGKDFRPFHQQATNHKGNAHLKLLMRDIKVSQTIIRDLFEENPAKRLVFVNSSTLSTGVEAVALDIIKTLEFQIDAFRAAADFRNGFSYLRKQIEQQGIFVLLLSDLGSHHTTIPVEVFRSFAFADDLAPYIVINRQDAVSGWSFTALHEVAHLWLGKSGVSGDWSENEIERFCNQVAGTILFRPFDRAQLARKLNGGSQCVVDEVGRAAREMNVSRAVIAYLLMLDKKISQACWETLQRQFKRDSNNHITTERKRRRTQFGGANYYTIRRYQLGDRLIDLTRYYVDAGLLSATRAGVVLGVAPTSVHPLLFPDRI
ncbi:MAG: ImmA/IrrE family metallo-endopeptidase, partial [Chloroflexi bacterium]|nr:ImmA/IrrE family metallo-endopeptidase [Chloroflexota bacterium]